MKGANWVALGIGVVITSTGAIGLHTSSDASSLSGPPAREALRERIEHSHEVARERCAAMAGAARDRCFIAAHAEMGAALMESAQPYAMRRG